MNPVSVDIKDVLVAEGIGTFGATSGWRIFIGEMQDSPHTIIAIYDTGGNEQQPLFNGDNLQNPVFDVKVRAGVGAYLAAYNKAVEIDNVLNLISGNAILTARNYEGIFRQTDIFFIGYDENKRPIFGLNYRTKRYLD
jgi:hypothetical protein